jgi:uncharacterized protein YbcI
VSEGERTRHTTGEISAAISNGLVKLFREYYGRGPVKAKTYLFDNYAVAVLEDSLTTAEATLVKAGRETMVREFRLVFQAEMAPSFHRVVEEATGRTVVTYHSQITFDPDVCFELFVLDEPPTSVHSGSDST